MRSCQDAYHMLTFAMRPVNVPVRVYGVPDAPAADHHHLLRVDLAGYHRFQNEDWALQ